MHPQRNETKELEGGLKDVRDSYGRRRTNEIIIAKRMREE